MTEQFVCGLDLGSSTAKFACLRDGQPVDCRTLTGPGLAAQLREALPPDAAAIAVTGVGAARFSTPGLILHRVAEFDAIAAGGLLLSSLPEALVVSVGTGTAFVHASAVPARHLGGSGIGGGTLCGLGRALLDTDSLAELSALAAAGSAARADLNVADILTESVPGLDPDLTVANFGRLTAGASRADIAAGIFNLVFQTVGVMAAFAARACNVRTVVLTGRPVTAPPAAPVFARLARLHGLRYCVPDRAAYATACGAATLFPHTG